MAAKLGSGGSHPQRRAFVLVDKKEVQGVFSSWDAAEAYADKNHLSLDRLLEFETNRNYPDHLHLMAARWGEKWDFVGEWSKFAPLWKKPPNQIRLDHYHAKGNKFVLFRQREFTWRNGMLQSINPMAPDEALSFADRSSARPERSSEPKFQAPLSPLKPLRPHHREEAEESEKPAVPESVPNPKSTIDAPTKDSTAAPKPKVKLRERKPLRLKSNTPGPSPIPEFRSLDSAPSDAGALSPSSVELAQAQLAAQGKGTNESMASEGKPRRIWPIRVLMPIFSILICWGLGVFWVFKPEPTAQNIVDQVTTLARARVITIEPGQVFFQLRVDPINQQRWVQSLGLDPISESDPFFIPTYHALDTWHRGVGFVRPPYAEIEVREWWKLRLRTVRYGFYHQWEDGSILLLDLETDLIIGWSQAARLPELLN